MANNSTRAETRHGSTFNTRCTPRGMRWVRIYSPVASPPASPAPLRDRAGHGATPDAAAPPEPRGSCLRHPAWPRPPPAPSAPRASRQMLLNHPSAFPRCCESRRNGNPTDPWIADQYRRLSPGHRRCGRRPPYEGIKRTQQITPHEILDLIHYLRGIAYPVIAPESPLRTKRAGRGTAPRHTGDREARIQQDVPVPSQDRSIRADPVQILDGAGGGRCHDLITLR